jgi:hypothetical protein
MMILFRFTYHGIQEWPVLAGNLLIVCFVPQSQARRGVLERLDKE